MSADQKKYMHGKKELFYHTNEIKTTLWVIWRLRLVTEIGDKICNETARKFSKKKTGTNTFTLRKRTIKTKGLERKTKIYQKD